MWTGSSFKTESEISDLKAIYKQFGAATCRPSVFLILLRQRKIRAQVGEHFAVSLLGNVHGSAVREGLRYEILHSGQGNLQSAIHSIRVPIASLLPVPIVRTIPSSNLCLNVQDQHESLQRLRIVRIPSFPFLSPF